MWLIILFINIMFLLYFFEKDNELNVEMKLNIIKG